MVLEQSYDVRELLPHIDPSLLDYQEWINVGMALKDAGNNASNLKGKVSIAGASRTVDIIQENVSRNGERSMVHLTL